jgi:hypothetical protein
LVGAFALMALFACQSGERDITVGSDADTSGNYWGRNVSKQFDRPQLMSLHEIMNSNSTKDEVADLNCRRRLPQHEYSVTLRPEGEYRERQVRLQMTPRLYTSDECLQQAVDFVFQRNVKDLDPGPPIDYGYKDPLTGGHLDTSKSVEGLPDKPECNCGPPQ